MKKDDHVINYFHLILKNELIAVNQFFLHSCILKKWGLIRLHNMEYQESMDEKQHADFCVARILFFSEILDIPKIDKFNVGKNVEEILKADLDLELCNIRDLRKSIAYMDLTQDYVSRNIMLKILIDEEKHVDCLENEFSFIKQIGIHKYLQLQIKE
ncbi:bacterioferritin [Blochmannia endosymbiont of Camponotus (Colobopsis) obliquus]|uniref:bacterioferritin n=1 Tax=Blochmannia endosymbiont of Camponotus (Colobopsis) obliquus TaxID=1505597 RepID=UPI00061A656A|nr:bacterioferritin [Blochmannia endosymbiont of Camponotus (Colobopsis) obliquus]AKC60359.1 bacterioferritin [Blochmannia endosymbiont of Camponotus (Colobopsis) obliquus]